jgi:hypothetical protein
LTEQYLIYTSLNFTSLNLFPNSSPGQTDSTQKQRTLSSLSSQKFFIMRVDDKRLIAALLAAHKGMKVSFCHDPGQKRSTGITIVLM